MKQPIAGVAPSESFEVTIATAWPSNAAYSLGRMLGNWYLIQGPLSGRAFRLGNLIAAASIPLALMMYFYKLLPWVGVTYTLTNRRVIVRRGRLGIEERSVSLGGFDAIKIQAQPGHAWYRAGDLVFLDGEVETFRLEGIARPEGFRTICEKAHLAYVGVKEVLEREKAMA